MIHVGGLLARQIDAYAYSVVKNYDKDHLYRIISTGRSHVGRLLHYFPFDDKVAQDDADDWCGWHNDHGSLTALTSAILVDQ